MPARAEDFGLAAFLQNLSQNMMKKQESDQASKDAINKMFAENAITDTKAGNYLYNDPKLKTINYVDPAAKSVMDNGNRSMPSPLDPIMAQKLGLQAGLSSVLNNVTATGADESPQPMNMSQQVAQQNIRNIMDGNPPDKNIIKKPLVVPQGEPTSQEYDPNTGTLKQNFDTLKAKTESDKNAYYVAKATSEALDRTNRAKVAKATMSTNAILKALAEQAKLAQAQYDHDNIMSVIHPDDVALANNVVDSRAKIDALVGQLDSFNATKPTVPSEEKTVGGVTYTKNKTDGKWYKQ